MWKKINSELFRNEFGHAIIIKRDTNNIPTYFFTDDNIQNLEIPIVDFFNNPIFRIESTPTELNNLKLFIESQIASLNEYKQGLYLKIVATEKIDSFCPINIYGNQSDSNLAHRIGKCHGITTTEFLYGTSGNAQLYGFIENSLWNFTPGKPVFLNGKNLSHSIPTSGFIQKIGTAKTNKSLYLSIQEPITL